MSSSQDSPPIHHLPFQYSLCNEPLIELSNPGASGSLFYVTSDDEFIIKTVMHKEAEFLQKLLPGYYMVGAWAPERFREGGRALGFPLAPVCLFPPHAPLPSRMCSRSTLPPAPFRRSAGAKGFKALADRFLISPGHHTPSGWPWVAFLCH